MENNMSDNAAVETPAALESPPPVGSVVARAHLVWLVGDKQEDSAQPGGQRDHDVRMPVAEHRFANGDPTVRIDIVRNLWLASEQDMQREELQADEEGPTCAICLDPMTVADSLVTNCGHVFHSQCCRQSESVSVKQYGHWGCPSCREPVSFVRTIFSETGQVPNVLEAKPQSSTAKQLLAVMQNNDLIAGTICGLLGVEDFVVGTTVHTGRESICGESGASLQPHEEEVLAIPAGAALEEHDEAPAELDLEPSAPDNTLGSEDGGRNIGERTLTGMSALSFTSLKSYQDSFVEPPVLTASSDGPSKMQKQAAVLSGVLDVAAFGNSAASLGVLAELGLTWVVEDVETASQARRETRVAEAHKQNKDLRIFAVIFLVVVLLGAGLGLYFMRRSVNN